MTGDDSRNEKRVFTVLAYTMLLSAFFVSCAQAKTSYNLNELFGVNELPEATISFYFPYQIYSSYTQLRQALDVIEKKSKKELNINLDFVFAQNTNEYDIIGYLASGKTTDVFFVNSGSALSLNQRLRDMYRDGIVKDISDIFPKYSPSYYTLLSKEELSLVTADGKILAIPSHFPGYGRNYAIVRDDLAKKYGIDTIRNYDDLEKYLARVRETEKNITPLALSDTEIGLFADIYGYVILDYAMGLVYKWNDPSMKLMAWEETPDYKSTIHQIRDWYEKGYITSDSTYVFSFADWVIGSGVYGAFIDRRDTATYYNLCLATKGVKQWRYKAFPLYTEKLSPKYPTTGGGVIAFNAKSANAERAIMFIDWIESSQENYDLLMYGIEGKNYIKKGTQFALPPKIKFDEAYINWYGRGAFTNLVWEKSPDIEPKTYMQDYLAGLENDKYPPHLGFVPDYGSVFDMANKRQDWFYKMTQSAASSLFSEEKIDDYIATQKKVGSDRIVSLVQQQLDEWKRTR